MLLLVQIILRLNYICFLFLQFLLLLNQHHLPFSFPLQFLHLNFLLTATLTINLLLILLHLLLIAHLLFILFQELSIICLEGSLVDLFLLLPFGLLGGLKLCLFLFLNLQIILFWIILWVTVLLYFLDLLDLLLLIYAGILVLSLDLYLNFVRTNYFLLLFVDLSLAIFSLVFVFWILISVIFVHQRSTRIWLLLFPLWINIRSLWVHCCTMGNLIKV